MIFSLCHSSVPGMGSSTALPVPGTQETLVPAQGPVCQVLGHGSAWRPLRGALGAAPRWGLRLPRLTLLAACSVMPCPLAALFASLGNLDLGCFS